MRSIVKHDALWWDVQIEAVKLTQNPMSGNTAATIAHKAELLAARLLVR
jgi:hypothetical protein